MEKTYQQTQQEKMDQEIIQAKANASKLDRYALYQKQRCESKGMNLPAPIHKDEDGNLHWVNRKLRRKAQRAKK